MGFYEKVKWVLGILMVFILILTTNLIDRNNFIRVKDSVASIYEDRLIAYDLIYEMSNAVHQKEVAMTSSDSKFFLEQNTNTNEAIHISIARFEQTKLTISERQIFNDLKQAFKALQEAEKSFIHNRLSDKNSLAKAIAKMKESLKNLSEIQLSEGRRQVLISKSAVDTVELFTHLEIYVLIILAIVIQIIIMYKPKQRNN